MKTTTTRLLAAALATLAMVLCFPAKASAQQVADSQITHSLEQAFKRDFRLRDADIQVSTFMGTATLKGTLDTYTDRHTAEQIAERTVGVQRVVNNIQVDSILRRDSELADDVRRRLGQSSFVRATDLDVSVSGGIVTLAGTVATWAQSHQAETAAREVRGVKLVRNNLTVRELSAPAGRADDAIRSDVEAELARDAYLASLALKVFVDEGVVRLEGEVPNLFHRERAAEEARLITGVRSVENQLVVMSQLILDMSPEPPTDQELRRIVLEELNADPRVAAMQIDAAVTRGHVTLVGLVGSMFERQAAERITRSVTGVRRVENQLDVMPIGRSDEDIQADVAFNLKSDSLLAKQTIEVKVRASAVTLSGEVSYHNSKFHAARLAARVRGVRSITDEIKVAWNTSTNDDTVRIRIEERLRSNGITRPIASHVKVTVQEGRVTLTGSVDRSSELLEAQRIAKLTDGARSVTNSITMSR